MKKTILSSVMLLILSILCIYLVSAETIDTSMITTNDQYYSVLFDGEGEAIVSLKLSIRNTEDNPITKFNLEIPADNILLLGVLQDVNDYTNSNTGYKKIIVSPQRVSDSFLLPINLIDPIEKNQATNILIVYKAQGYAKKYFGVYNFVFESAKIGYMTNTVRVAINVQQDLILKGLGSNVNYQPNFGLLSASMAKVSNAEMAAPDVSNSIRTYSQDITYQPGYVKSSNFLDPNENFNVKGKYASSAFALYWTNYAIIMIVIALIIYIVIALTRKYSTKPKNIKKETEISSTSPNVLKNKKISTQENMTSQDDAANSDDSLISSSHPVITALAYGLIALLCLIVLWIMTITLIYVGRSLGSGFRDIFSLLLVIFSIIISLGIAIGMPFYVSSKYGSKTGLFTAICIILLVFIGLLITFFILGSLSRSIVYY